MDSVSGVGAPRYGLLDLLTIRTRLGLRFLADAMWHLDWHYVHSAARAGANNTVHDMSPKFNGAYEFPVVTS